LNNSMAACRK